MVLERSQQEALLVLESESFVLESVAPCWPNWVTARISGVNARNACFGPFAFRRLLGKHSNGSFKITVIDFTTVRSLLQNFLELSFVLLAHFFLSNLASFLLKQKKISQGIELTQILLKIYLL
jgi:hypothetical protein